MITIDSNGFEGLVRFARDIRRRTYDLTPFWDNFAAPLVTGEINEIFLTEGRGSWPPLSAEYAEEKESARPGKTILRYDDHYIRAATETTAPGNIYKKYPTRFIWGVDEAVFDARFGAPYPIQHEEGIGVPKRPVFNLINEGGRLDRELVKLGNKWLTEQVAEAENKL